ncbi:hypothetical protein GYMLUDRAFT_251650 [Collybiopsis luxurians FD-317 M1]|uniref:Uncharacterized protein n=1 Tax=Collybiopsis luxurians FD-317 M1 TaxID=944289 RepID=A0A0D0BBX9_9AGAR|nr:hypothetical protein GYMLUDRAFT_251650 [Collybiopsis luxurians FD-317 M1]
MVSTLQALLDALHQLRYGYILMGVDICLIIFDEAHHVVNNDPYNRIMQEFYHKLLARDFTLTGVREGCRGRRLWVLLRVLFSVEILIKLSETNLDSGIVSPVKLAPNLPNTLIVQCSNTSSTAHLAPYLSPSPALEHMSNGLDIESDPTFTPSATSSPKRHPAPPKPVGQMYASDREAPEYTTRLFGSISGSTMKWDELVQWRWDPQEAKFLERYPRFDDSRIRYPHLQVRPFHPLTNFLLPLSLISETESFYVFLIPSILRAIALNLAADSLRSVLFTNQSVLSMTPTLSLSPPSPLRSLRSPTVINGLSCWVETGAAVGSICLTRGVFDEEGHTRLAKESVTSMLYTWLFEFDRLQNKWEPLYIATTPSVPTEELSKLSCVTVLVEIVDWLISAVYVYDGLSFSEVQSLPQFFGLEKVIWYTFCRRLLFVEALTLPSCQEDHGRSDFSYHARGKDDSPELNGYSLGHIFKFAIVIRSLHITIVLQW